MTQKPLIIGTHSGTFHCDEALACYMLSNHTKKYKNAKIIRSRNPDILKDCDILVDVGATFDINKNRFDHHQKSFNEYFDNNDPEKITKLSSAGLIYKYFGKEIIQDIYTNHNNLNTKRIPLNDTVLNDAHPCIYKKIIEEVDAIDNGVSQYDTDIQPKYSIHTSLGARISRLNPSWNENANDNIRLNLFHKAMDITGEELKYSILNYFNSHLPARNIVINGLNNRYNIDKSGLILLFESYVPYLSHYFDLESELNIKDKPLYCIFPDSNNGWRIRAMPTMKNSFKCKKFLPDIWRGKRNNELNKCGYAGINDWVFVHSSGFIGGVLSKKSAIIAARFAINYNNNNNGCAKHVQIIDGLIDRFDKKT